MNFEAQQLGGGALGAPLQRGGPHARGGANGPPHRGAGEPQGLARGATLFDTFPSRFQVFFVDFGARRELEAWFLQGFAWSSMDFAELESGRRRTRKA